MSDQPCTETRPLEAGSAWSSSPCSSCGGSPCCTHLPLIRWRAETRADLQYAAALLDHEAVELGLCDNGGWVAYYCRSCRELNPQDHRCLVHGTADQPEPCRTYAARACWYRRVFSASGSPEMIRLDRFRLQRIIDSVRFRGSGQIDETPSWDGLRSLVADLPVSSEPSAAPAENRQELDLDPCRLLLFPLPRPWKSSHVEFLRFRLGFPGVEIFATDAAWLLSIQARCRFLVDGNCLRDGSCRSRLPWRISDPSGTLSSPHPQTTLAGGFIRLGLPDLCDLPLAPEPAPHAPVP